jgi:hypothetical protein
MSVASCELGTLAEAAELDRVHTSKIVSVDRGEARPIDHAALPKELA